jgi:hypothetical protein
MIRKLFIYSLVLFLCACGHMQERLKAQNLNKAIDEYAYALRWHRIDDAVSYHKNKDGTKPAIDLTPMNDVRVTGFSIDKKVLGKDMMDATVTGEYRYYKEDYGTLNTLKFEQHWWFDPEAERWYVDSAFPKFK